MTKTANNRDKTILIASSSMDRGSWRPVEKILAGRGFNVVTYQADKVADGLIGLEMSVRGDEGLQINYDGKLLDVENIDAAWYRRPAMFAPEQPDKALQVTTDAERKMIQYSLWDSMPKDAWLNEPQKIQHAEHKLTQLVVAGRLGFVIPDTLVSNSWGPIMKSLPEHIVWKPSFGLLYSDNELKMMYTNKFTNDKSKLPVTGNPFPGFWQPYLSKAREWRITVVGDQCFSAAIYTDDDAKDDWRLHQMGPKVKFKKAKFPDELVEKCKQYLRFFGLKYGAFDFIEDEDGRITFLECNANGQYGWLEDELGLPISEAIADELAKIAHS